MSTTPEPEDTGREPGGEVVPFPRQPDDPAPDTPDSTSDTSFEVQLDDEPAGKPEPVDAGEGIVLPDPDGESYPVIPEHLRSLAGIGEALSRHGRRFGHRASFHGIRAPRYLLLSVVWGVVGVFRLAGRQLSWWWLSEQDFLRSHAVANADSREWMKLHREAKDTRRVRGIMLAGEAFALLLALLALMRFAPWWGWLAVIAVVLPALARAGRPEDRPIIAPATTVPRFRVLNADVVLRAYYAAGLGHPDKPGQQVEFESAMTRDGEGSRVKVILPYGTGFDAAVKAKDDLASGLDVAPSQVYLTRDKTSHRRHTLWVADRDPLAIPAGRTPLLDGKRRSIWQPAPFGLDERGRKVTLLLLWISILIGAQPRKGKTFSGRLLALYAALDPFVRLSRGGREELPGLERLPEDRLPLHPRHRAEPGRGPGSAVHRRADRDQEATSRTPTTSWPRCRWPSAPKASSPPNCAPSTPSGCSCGCWSWRNSRTTSSCPTRSSTRSSPTCCRSSWPSARRPA